MNRPLRLLYFVNSLGVGGANQTTVTIARQMKAAGHEVVFASEDGPLRDRLAEAAIPHVVIRTEVRHPSGSAVRALVRTIREYGIELLCPNGFDCTIDAVPAGLWTGCPVLPTYGGMSVPPYPHPRLATVNVFSEELKESLVQDYRWPREVFRHLIARIDGALFHPEVQGDTLRAELGIDTESLVLVMVCRQDVKKVAGVLRFLDATPQIHIQYPAARIVLLGDGNCRARVLNRIKQVHEQCGQEFILAPGSSRRIAEAFAMATLVVANGARSALEGMAVGRPIISVGPNGFCGVFHPRSIEGFRRFNFDKGRLTGNPHGDGAHLIDAVSRILSDPELRKRLGEFGRQYAREHLIIQNSVPRYEALYREGIRDGWPRHWGRSRCALNWTGTVVRYYGYRLRKRLGTPDTDPEGGLNAPPPGLAPDWRSGLIEQFSC